MATPIDVVMSKCRDIFRRKIGEIVRYQPHKKSASCQIVAYRAKNLPWPAQTFASSSRFHPNRFTFGGVIADRVKAVLRQIHDSPEVNITSKQIFNYIYLWFQASKNDPCMYTQSPFKILCGFRPTPLALRTNCIVYIYIK